MVKQGARATRWDWRDSWQAATDFALLGVLVTLASLPVVTLAAALGTGSAAATYWYVNRGMPPVRTLARWYLRALLPGLGAFAAGALAATVLVLDVRLLSRGAVPGATAILVLTWVLIIMGAGVVALTVVRVGDGEGRGWRDATRWAGRTGLALPWLPPALLAVLAVVAVLGFLIPITIPLLVGFALFATRVLTARLVQRAE